MWLQAECHRCHERQQDHRKNERANRAKREDRTMVPWHRHIHSRSLHFQGA